MEEMRGKAKKKKGEKEKKGEGKPLILPLFQEEKEKGRDFLNLFPQEKFPIATPMQKSVQLYTKSFSCWGATSSHAFPGLCPWTPLKNLCYSIPRYFTRLNLKS